MTAAIYSRKSKLTETGDSIKNQIAMCKDYAALHFGECDFLIYEDEGFSGGNTDRPMFKQMLWDAKSKRFQALICYRLDRISRNVNDFSSTLKILENNEIAFVSVTERFDTSTPMGKAMLSISSVFAELERDTIAQRITDNFTQLAKTGRYLTGRPPEGYMTRRVMDASGKSYNVLEIVPDEADKIRLIYKKYLEWESNRRVELFCLSNGIKTRAGCEIRSDWITRVLTHQLYIVADEAAYEYFNSQGFRVITEGSAFDGTRGVTVFRRTKAGRGRHMETNEPEGIIISVGSHEGIISSQDWIAVQKIIRGRSVQALSTRANKNPTRKAVGKYGALNGILRCSCGAFMKPVCIRNGKFYYACLTKEKSRRTLCNNKNLRHDIDTMITGLIHKELFDAEILAGLIPERLGAIENKDDGTTARIAALEKQKRRNDKSIENLILRLFGNEDGSQQSKTSINDFLLSHIEAQVKRLEENSKQIMAEIAKLRIEKTEGSNETHDYNRSMHYAKTLANSELEAIKDILTKRNIIKSIVKSIEWDGSTLRIRYHFAVLSSDNTVKWYN